MIKSFEYKVFLSHSSNDKQIVKKLAGKLKNDGIKVWFDEWEISPGDDILLKIEEGLENSNVLLLIMSPNTFGSDWMKMERSTILFRDPINNERRFIPILIKECDNIPDTIQRLKYIDWRNETEEAYQEILISLKSNINNTPKLQIANPIIISSNDLNDDLTVKFTILLEGSARLLELDRLKGSWGKTIGKYFELTQDEDTWTKHQIFKYLLTGSLTHTYHALNGLCEYYKLTEKYFDPNIAFNVYKYIKIWRLYNGEFATPVTNFDASNKEDRDHILQMIRHTSCGILTINRLLELRNISKKSLSLNKNTIHIWEELYEILNNYNIDALKALAVYSDLIARSLRIWGKTQYTPAYVILAIEEGLQSFSKLLLPKAKSNLLEIKNVLIDFAFNNALKTNERFFCQSTNKKAFYYYTLLLLENFLHVKDFTSDSRAKSFCKKLIQALNDIVLATGGGLPFGRSEIHDKSWLDYLDIGISARYLIVLSKYTKIFPEIDPKFKKAFSLSLNFILTNSLDFESSLKNSLTHGWEAILELISIVDDPLKKIVKDKICNHNNEIDQDLRRFVDSISKRDFHGRQSSDLKLMLFNFLNKDPKFSKIIDQYKKEGVINLLQEPHILKNELECNFSKTSFLEFFVKNSIPHIEDATLEEMIDLTLFQFQV